MTATPIVGNVLYIVDDLPAAVRFYRNVLGLPLKFTDGARFAALDGGGVTLALASRSEDVTGGVPAASLKVADVAAAVSAATAGGARVVRPVEDGPHETRAVLADPDDNLFVLYASKRSSS